MHQPKYSIADLPTLSSPAGCPNMLCYEKHSIFRVARLTLLILLKCSHLTDSCHFAKILPASSIGGIHVSNWMCSLSHSRILSVLFLYCAFQASCHRSGQISRIMYLISRIIRHISLSICRIGSNPFLFPEVCWYSFLHNFAFITIQQCFITRQNQRLL